MSNTSVGAIMRIVFAFLCAAGAACVVDVTSNAGAATLGRPPHQAAHSEGPTKRRLRVDEPTDEERVISADPDSIAAVVASYIAHQLKPKLPSDPDSIAAVVPNELEPKLSSDPDSIAAVVPYQLEPKISADPDSIAAVVASYIAHQPEPKLSSDPDSIAAVVPQQLEPKLFSDPNSIATIVPYQLEPEFSVDHDSIVAGVDNYIPHQLEPKKSADDDSIAVAMDNQVEPNVDVSALPIAMISSQVYAKVLVTKTLSPFELYKALGLQKLSKQKEFHTNHRAFNMQNNLLFFYNWHRLRLYTSSFAKSGEEVKTILHSIYLNFCDGDDGEVKSLAKALDTANYLVTVFKEIEFLQNEKTPKTVLDELGFKPKTDLFVWDHMRLWMGYVDLYRKVHYDQRIDAVTATGIKESVLLAMLLRTGQAPGPGTPRRWMQDWLIENWRDEHYPPLKIYNSLGFQQEVAPDYDSYEFSVWTEYIDLSGGKKIAALEKIITRETMVKSLSSGYQGFRKRTMIYDAIIHLKKEKEEMELKNLDTTEVDKYLQDLNADPIRGRRWKRQKVNK